MSASKAPDGNISYQCQRRPVAGHLEADYRYRGRGATFLAAGGSLEFFLTERYRLFSWHPRRRRLYTGEVWHDPYPLQEAEVAQWSAVPAYWDRQFSLHGPPVTQHFSRGVEVGIFPLRPLS